MKGLEWYIARRYLASRRKGRFLSLITWIAVGGIFVGVAALITVVAVMTGLQRDLRQKILGNNPHVYVFDQGAGLRLSDWSSVLPVVDTMAEVVSAAPFVMAQVGVTASGEYGKFGSLYGVQRAESRAPLTDVERRIAAGELHLGPTESGHPGILLGQRLAQELVVYPGMVLTVASIENVKVSGTGDLVPSVMNFEVTGVFSTGMFEYDSQNMYAPISAVRELLGLGEDQASGLAVNVGDPWVADAVARRIADALGYRYWTTDWMTLNHSLFSALKLEKIAMSVILFLIILVAAFNIISTLIMVVADKTREIGILKSMGMTSARVLRIFIYQGLAIGLIGTALGAVGGLALVAALARYKFIELPADVYFLDNLPVALDFADLATILVMSVVIAFAATIYPALQASRMLPVEAIRHE